MRFKRSLAAVALTAAAGVGIIGHNATAAPRWYTIGHVAAIDNVQSHWYGGNAIYTHTGSAPGTIRIVNSGETRLLVSWDTICFQRQVGQPYPYELTRGMDNVTVRPGGSINATVPVVAGAVGRYVHCTVSAREISQRTGQVGMKVQTTYLR